MSKKRVVYGVARVPGLPDANVTNRTVATMIAALQMQIAQLRAALAHYDPRFADPNAQVKPASIIVPPAGNWPQ